MLVTRTEMFTDWVFQGAHAGERAATVGRGLMVGHIYFRYTDDFLKAGETIQREISFVELSDGSTYQLGAGASAEKITIIDQGVVSGEVSIQVIGKDEIGVGVSRVLRHVTIQYDDGKVPVLDTEQLDGMLEDLSESLTESMVGTANAVKEELRSELKSDIIDVEADITAGDKKVEAKIDTEVHNIGQRIDRVSQNVVDLTNKMEAKGHTRMNVAMWRTPGIYTTDHLEVKNILSSQPTVYVSDPNIEWDSVNQSIKIVGIQSGKNRVLRVVVTGNLQIDEASIGNIVAALRDNKNNVIAQQHMFIQRERMVATTIGCQFALELFIGATEATHNAFTTGVRITLENRMNQNHKFVLGNSSNICITLLTQE